MIVLVGLLSASCSPSVEPGTTTAPGDPTSTSISSPGTTTVDTLVPTTAPTTSTRPVTPTSPPSSTTSTAVVRTTTTTPATGAAVVVTRMPTNERVIALTFDAGSDRGFAAEILDTLAARGIRASFGMTGRWAESNPDLLRRMADEGHSLINHTYDHPHMETLGTEQRLQQLARTEEIIDEITGVTTKPYFRPPYGSYNNRVLIDVASAGYLYSIMWTVDCLGWKGLPPADVATRCRDALGPGAILLMHVGAASTDYAALDDILAAVDREGYRYVTIEELLP